MKHLLFIRHGESVANAGGVTLPHADIALSERGRREASIVAGLLPASPSRIYCSPFLRRDEHGRAVQPAHRRAADRAGRAPGILGDRPCAAGRHERGTTGRIAYAYWADAAPGRRMGANSETFAEFHARVRLGIDTLRMIEDRSVVFGHGIWLGLAYWMTERNMASTPDDMRAFRVYQSGIPLPNCGCHRVSLDEGGAVRIRFDADTHRRTLEAL